MITRVTQTVYQAFADTTAKWPDRPVFNVLEETASAYGIAAGETTYRDAMVEIETLVQAYASAGYTAGHRVLLLLENRPDYFWHWIALNKLGASVVPVNPDLRAAELEYLISHSEPAAAVVIPHRAKDITAASHSATFALPVATLGAPIPPPRPNSITAEPIAGATREAAVLYTSGTTGNPKGCVLPNTYFLTSGLWYQNIGGLCTLTLDGERMITPLPTFHMNAMACSFMAMVAIGGCLSVLDRFHPKTWWDSVLTSRATCLHYLGVMPSILMKASSSDTDQSHTVRFGFGAGIDPKLHIPFQERFGFPLVESWGMTETGAANAITDQGPERIAGRSCLGKPSSDVEIKLVDEAGQNVPVGTPGELLIRRAGQDPKLGFFSHYYKNKQATDEAWKDGWFHTGDLVRTDETGALFFVDRQKNIIRRSGENIAAVEVESALLKHPDITAVAVTSVPDTLREEEVFACIESPSANAQTARSIMDHCLDQMAYYKAPAYIAFVQKLPLTSTQKVKRADVKALAESLLTDPKTHITGYLKKRQAT